MTDKSTPHTPRLDVIQRLANEIASALHDQPEIQLLIGHGSGSYGHIPAKKYATRQGVISPTQWQGFAEVWAEAHALNQIISDSLIHASLPVLVFPPSASLTTRNGKVENWDIYPIQSALQHGLIPVVYGDVIFDRIKGGTILSTEELFFHLARLLKPQRILLAGFEEGVWADYPFRTNLVKSINDETFAQFSHQILGSSAVDVTGGMVQKVKSMLALIEAIPELKACIFSGNNPGTLYQTILGAESGTTIH